MIEFSTAKGLEFLFLFGAFFAFGIYQLRELASISREKAAKAAAALDARGLYRPPAPVPKPELRALADVVARGERDLLTLLPDRAYRETLFELGKSRRGILFVARPDLVTHVFAYPDGVFPKNDLMVGALEVLVGDSLFVTSGANWRRQRRMIEPAFSHMRVDRAFDAMSAAIDVTEVSLDAARGPVSIDKTMAHLTADIICRTIFSTSLESRVARDVFDDFLIFERSCASVDLGRLLLGKPFDAVPQPAPVMEACQRIRRHLGAMLDQRFAEGAPAQDDIAAAVVAARDPDTGEPFTREELIDQIGVFFLAGHETTASSLTWAFFILSRQPETVARMRAEIAAVAGDGPIRVEHAKRLVFTRNVFRETMRLYPPLTFLPRVAAKTAKIGPRTVTRGTMVMIAPWAIHRHETLWAAPDRFDPDRFAPERAEDAVPGSYIPFGLGPRVCVGAAFATIEATLILARLVRRYDVEALEPERVRPVARLTVRPEHEIMARFVPVPGSDHASAPVAIPRTEERREPVPA